MGDQPVPQGSTTILPATISDHPGSTIITSQVPVEHWHEVIANPTVADAILDRLIHNAHRLQLDGPSMRKLQAAELHNEPRSIAKETITALSARSSKGERK